VASPGNRLKASLSIEGSSVSFSADVARTLPVSTQISERFRAHALVHNHLLVDVHPDGVCWPQEAVIAADGLFDQLS
jgi:hypothetical protein